MLIADTEKNYRKKKKDGGVFFQAIESECNKYTKIKRGERQGCFFSPGLFNLYSEAILRDLEDLPGFITGGHNLNNIRYADDTVLIADTEKNYRTAYERLQRRARKIRQSIGSSAKRLIRNAHYRSRTPRSSRYRSLSIWEVS